MSARRSRRRGYTFVEVMAALTVLGIGASGVIALQKATLINSTNARNLSIANSIARTWAERLRVDALQWNERDEADRVSDLVADTDWIKDVEGTPFPAKVTPAPILTMGMPDADVLGTDIFPGDPAQTAFCTHLRFRQFTSTFGGPLWANLIRVEIRVFWERNGNPVSCATFPADIDTHPERYGAVYLTTSVRRNPNP
jgi:prepilin-type N-terminal cleavage/methylation domain-containing protein